MTGKILECWSAACLPMLQHSAQEPVNQTLQKQDVEMRVLTEKTPGIVVLCHADGEIVSVVQDRLGLASHIEPGRLLSSFVERESFGKMLNFLLELRQNGSVFDWQLNVVLNGQVLTLNFAGTVFDEHLLILAVRDRHDMLHLYEELIRMNNAQTNELRVLLKDRASVTYEQQCQDTRYYDELTRLYNELANLQREMAKKNMALERLNEQKNRFLGMAAHDLRNPLDAIMMYSEFLLDEVAASLSEEHQEFLRIIRSSSEFMLNLVEDFLDLATSEAGKLQLHLWPVDIAALVRNNVALNTLLASRKGMTLEANYIGDIPEVLADASKIEQVLNNLVSNAVKFSPPGSVITITVSATTDDILITVADQGPGIPSDELEHMFEPFEHTSVKSSSGEKSSGLGLAIARKIVLEHHGKLWADSVVGSGSTFYVALPREMPENQGIR